MCLQKSTTIDHRPQKSIMVVVDGGGGDSDSVMVNVMCNNSNSNNNNIWEHDTLAVSVCFYVFTMSLLLLHC